MSSSVGFTIPFFWKNNPVMFQTTNQKFQKWVILTILKKYKKHWVPAMLNLSISEEKSYLVGGFNHLEKY